MRRDDPTCNTAPTKGRLVEHPSNHSQTTIPAQPVPASDLVKGMRIRAGFLPLMQAAEVLFAYPYTLHGREWVCVVYLYDGDGQPAPDTLLAEALIPVTSVPVKHGCMFGTVASVSLPCEDFPLCECTPPVGVQR